MSQLVSQQEQVKTVRDLIERSKKQIQMALPRHMNADRMGRIAMTSIMRDPRLLECTPQSLIGAIIQSAQLGLEPDDLRGMAYLIPFRNNKRGTVEVQLLPGYKGLMDLARRSAKVSAIEADVVHTEDTFSYRKGTEQFLHHVKSEKADPGGIKCVYALARYNNGQCQFVVLTPQDVEKIRKSSRAGEEGPWVTHFDEMAKKTALRQLCKLLPSSSELQTAVALDEMVEAGVPQNLEVFSDRMGETSTASPGNGEKRTKLDALAEKMRGKETERRDPVNKDDAGVSAPSERKSENNPTTRPAESQTAPQEEKPPPPKKAAKGKAVAKSAGGEGTEPREEKFDPKETALALIRSATRKDFHDVRATVLKMIKEIKGAQNLLDVTNALNARQIEIFK